jgi:hypothetical protein
MADSLVLTGVKDVKKHTGTEMLLTRPKRGGDTHSLKEWWKVGPNKCYVMCTVFDVTTASGTVKLVLDTNAGTNLRIDHDGSFNFDFYGINEVRRGALFTSSYELIEHYVFPIISGGKVMTVTPAGGGVRPTAAVAPSSSTPAPTPTPTPSASPVAVEGYYPLYANESDADAAGDGSSHSHTFSGVTYYMPNGVTYYHGDYNSGGGGY